MKKRKATKPKYKNLMDLEPYFKSDGPVVDGEPNLLKLHRFEHDRSLRGQENVGCCACGYIHLMTYDIWTEGKGDWWLKARAYSRQETWPKKVIDAKGKVRK